MLKEPNKVLLVVRVELCIEHVAAVWGVYFIIPMKIRLPDVVSESPSFNFINFIAGSMLDYDLE